MKIKHVGKFQTSDDGLSRLYILVDRRLLRWRVSLVKTTPEGTSKILLRVTYSKPWAMAMAHDMKDMLEFPITGGAG